MKKMFLFLIFSSLSLSLLAQAQIGIGLKAGANISKMDGFENTDNYTSFNGGVFTLIKLTKLGIQPEVLYSGQGYKTDAGETKAVYLNVPVMLKLYIAGGFNIQAGPQFGFLMSAEDANGDDIKDNFKSSDVSASVGLGFDAPFGLLFDARYNIGLTDINNVDGAEDAVKNRVIQISIGYKLFKFGN